MTRVHRLSVGGSYAGFSLEPPGEWVERAACTVDDAELFDIGETTRSVDETRQQIRAALDVCDRCPVKAECLDDLLAAGISFTHWQVRGGRVFKQGREWRGTDYRDRGHCTGCGTPKSRRGSLCDACYRKETNAAATRYEDWLFLKAQGFGVAAAAQRLGLSKKTLERAIHVNERRSA